MSGPLARLASVAGRSSVVRDLSDLARPYYRKLDPWTGLSGLDRRLVAYLPDSPGFFVEAGGNDGLKQSNTYFLESRRGWRGLLVEPVPRLAKRCERNRPRARVINAALVPPDIAGRPVSLVDVDLMTVTASARELTEVQVAHVAAAEKAQGIVRQEVLAPGRTLSDCIESAGLPRVDLLSLDVEGFELGVLQGLDLRRHAPTWALVETQDPDAVSESLGAGYERIGRLSQHDWLFRSREPRPGRTGAAG